METNDFYTDEYIPRVMASFSCTREMAESIIKSSMENGEFNSIRRMCSSNTEKEKRVRER